MDGNVVRLPARAREESPRPSCPEQFPEWCYSWVAATPTRAGHWRVNRYAVLRFQAEVARAAVSQQPGVAAVPLEVATPALALNVDPDQLDRACRRFYRTRGRLATRDERDFFLAKGRWPLCWKEIDQWRSEATGVEEVVLQLLLGTLIAVGSLLAVWLGG